MTVQQAVVSIKVAAPAVAVAVAVAVVVAASAVVLVAAVVVHQAPVIQGCQRVDLMRGIETVVVPVMVEEVANGDDYLTNRAGA